MALGTFTLFLEWQIEGYFLLTGEDKDGYELDPDELRYLLFAWDEESFYGAMIYTNEMGIELSAANALRFLSNPATTLHIAFLWDDRANRYIEMAKLIRSCIEEGRYALDEERMGQGVIGWKLQFNEREDVDASITTDPMFSTWVDQIMEEEILSNLEKLKASQLKLRAKLRSSVGSSQQSMFGLEQLMQYDWKLAIDDQELTEEEFRQLLAEKTELVNLRGKWVHIDAGLFRQIRKIVSQAQKNKGLSIRDVMEMHLAGRLSSVEVESTEEESASSIQLEVELTKPLQQLFTQLKQESSIPQLSPPSTLHGMLRNYQLAGASWMLFLRRYGLGGCLADDMGLGKTIQWITYLLHVKEQERPTASSLLICPTSVLGNWQKELKRFAPSLSVYLHYGSKRKKGEEFLDSIAGSDLVLTSYALSHLDEEELSMLEWDAICLDEAQNIKNAYTKQSIAIRQLRSKHRMALTGTPIENRLTELWSIYDFINPGYLGSLRQFSRHYVNPIERSNDAELISRVQMLTRPFLLRRVKKDPAVQLDLPEKNETKNYITLTSEQAALYEQVIQDLFARIERSTPMERRGLILATLTKLKQLSNHPALYLKESGYTQWKERSNKLERLLEMVGEIRDEGDRCLIFTQFVETGYLLKQVLEEERQEAVLFLHGGVTKAKRDEMIESFQDRSSIHRSDNGIFILSLKAGGIGLNLTAANHVFHFDRWWNPAVENQATDRAYRIGQLKNVQVHKFISLGTLEERIDEMIDRKSSLSEQIISGGESWITELSTDELRDIFTLRKEWI